MQFIKVKGKNGINTSVRYSDGLKAIRIHTLIFLFDKETEEVSVYRDAEGVDLAYIGRFDTNKFNIDLCKKWIRKEVSIELQEV